MADIQNSESVRYTVVNGVVFESRTMKQVYPEERPRGRFFWEEAGRR